jgi:SH3-like domain-containing protein
MTRKASAGLRPAGGALRRLVGLALAIVAGSAGAADFRSTSEPATILYDAPSAKAKPLFVLGRDTPLEVIVPVEGWIKVRDAGGTIGWVERRALAERRVLVVRVPVADVRANPDDGAVLVFRAEQNVLLELAEPAAGATSTATPGWVKVRHRDGQAGFVRIAQIFGL